MIVYEVFEEKNHEGKYYTKWELPVGFPIPHDFVLVPPSEDLKNPKFDRTKNIWVESEDDLVKDLKAQVADLETKLKASTTRSEMTEMALLELYDMILTR